MGVLLLIGLVFAAAGFFFLYDYRKFSARSDQLQGKLFALSRYEKHHSNSKIEVTYHPVIEYIADKTWQFQSPSGFKAYMPYQIGDAIPLRVSRDNPREARVYSKDNFYVGILLLILGLELSVIAAADLLVNGSLFYLLSGIGIVGYGISKLKSSFDRAVSKLQSFRSNTETLVDGLAWEKSVPPPQTESWIYDLSAIDRKGSHAILGPILMLVGTIFLGGGGYWLQDRVTFISAAVHVPGEVTRIDEVRSTATDRVEFSYYPFVSFTTRDGKSMEFRSDVGNSVSVYQQGDKVQVYYLLAQPADAILDQGIVMNFAWSILLLTIGGMLFFIGLLVFGRR